MLFRIVAAAMASAMSMGQVAIAAEKKPVVAVFEIEDATKRPKRVVESLTDYLRVKLSESGEMRVVDKGEQEAQLKKKLQQEKKESYKPCFDTSCQIPLGKELAADKILRSKLSHIGKTFIITAELIDLSTGASAGGASDKSDGTEDQLVLSVERIAKQLLNPSESKAVVSEVKESKEKDEVPSVGCADGTREGFTDAHRFPKIAACGAKWAMSSMRAPRTGTPCGGDKVCGAPADACAQGWHVCGATASGPRDLSDRISVEECETVGPGGFVVALSDQNLGACGVGGGMGAVCCGKGCVQQNGSSVWPNRTAWFGMIENHVEACGEIEMKWDTTRYGLLCCKD